MSASAVCYKTLLQNRLFSSLRLLGQLTWRGWRGMRDGSDEHEDGRYFDGKSVCRQGAVPLRGIAVTWNAVQQAGMRRHPPLDAAGDSRQVMRILHTAQVPGIGISRNLCMVTC
jgi:hypothetical protein